jgi:uncharacterized protein
MKANSDGYVLVTGASAGIGKALAIAFAKRSYNVLLVALPQSKLEDTCIEIRMQFNVDVQYFCLDLSLDEGPLTVYNWCKVNGYNVSVLVNNAGFGNFKMFSSTNIMLLDTMMKLNNSTLMKLTHYFVPELAKFKSSYILNVSSLGAFMPLPQKTVYSATKSFVYAFSDSLRFELKQIGVHVSCLCPGGTLTERIKESLTAEQKKRQSFFQTPECVAEYAVAKLLKKKFRIIPGWRNKLLYCLSQALPEFLKIMLINVCFKPKELRPLRPPTFTMVRTLAMLRL